MIKTVKQTCRFNPDEPPCRIDETLLSAEESLAEDWLRAEEDEAWAHLQ